MPISKAVGEFVAQDREVPAIAVGDKVAAAVAKMKATSTEGVVVLDDIAYAINKMAVGGFRNVPLVDDGKVVAVLNVHDVIGHLFDLFVEVSDRESSELNPWTDVGGG